MKLTNLTLGALKQNQSTGGVIIDHNGYCVTVEVRYPFTDRIYQVRAAAMGEDSGWFTGTLADAKSLIKKKFKSLSKNKEA